MTKLLKVLGAIARGGAATVKTLGAIGGVAGELAVRIFKYLKANPAIRKFFSNYALYGALNDTIGSLLAKNGFRTAEVKAYEEFERELLGTQGIEGILAEILKATQESDGNHPQWWDHDAPAVTCVDLAKSRPSITTDHMVTRNWSLNVKKLVEASFTQSTKEGIESALRAYYYRLSLETPSDSAVVAEREAFENLIADIAWMYACYNVNWRYQQVRDLEINGSTRGRFIVGWPGNMNAFEFYHGIVPEVNNANLIYAGGTDYAIPKNSNLGIPGLRHAYSNYQWEEFSTQVASHTYLSSGFKEYLDYLFRNVFVDDPNNAQRTVDVFYPSFDENYTWGVDNADTDWYYTEAVAAKERVRTALGTHRPFMSLLLYAGLNLQTIDTTRPTPGKNDQIIKYNDPNLTEALANAVYVYWLPYQTYEANSGTILQTRVAVKSVPATIMANQLRVSSISGLVFEEFDGELALESKSYGEVASLLKFNIIKPDQLTTSTYQTAWDKFNTMLALTSVIQWQDNEDLYVHNCWQFPRIYYGKATSVADLQTVWSMEAINDQSAGHFGRFAGYLAESQSRFLADTDYNVYLAVQEGYSNDRQAYTRIPEAIEVRMTKTAEQLIQSNYLAEVNRTQFGALVFGKTQFNELAKTWNAQVQYYGLNS